MFQYSSIFQYARVNINVLKIIQSQHIQLLALNIKQEQIFCLHAPIIYQLQPQAYNSFAMQVHNLINNVNINKVKIITRMKPISAILLLHILIQTVFNFEFASLIVNADSKVINTLTTYQIDFDRTQDSNFQASTLYLTSPITPSHTATVLFPNVYTLTTVSCIASIDSGVQFNPTCNVVGNRVVASNLVTVNTFIGKFSISILNVLNPSPAIETDYFTGTLGSDTSGPGYYASSIALEPGAFTSCYSTFSPTTVNSTADMLITLTPKNQILSTGYVVIQFPLIRRWINDISTTNYLPISATMSCSNKSQNVLTSIQCAGNNIFSTITATNIFSNSITTSFSFSINNFLSPPTNQQSDVIVATSYSVDGFKIDTCNFYVSDLTPKAMTNIVITSFAGTAMTVNLLYSIKFTFVITDTLAQADTFTIAFPAGSAVTFNSATVVSNFSSSGIVSSFQTASLTLTLSLSNPQYTFARGTTLYISMGSYKAPPSTEPTSQFKITAYRNNFKKLEGTSTFSAVSSTITSTTPTMLSSTVNANTSYTFKITLLDAISSAGKIKITFPSTITILGSSPSCATLTGTGVAIQPVCAYNLVENSITLTSLNSSASDIAAQTLTIVISGLKNPDSIKLSGSFTVTSYYKGTDISLVAVGTIGQVTATVAQIGAGGVTVTGSSGVVNDVGVTYSITHAITHRIKAGGYFSILVPLQIQTDTTSTPSSCSINVASTSYIQTPCTATVQSSGTLITFSNPFSSDATVNTVIIARISTVFKNPSSTRPTSSFEFRTFNADGFAVSFVNSALSIQMTTPASFSTLTLSRNSAKNYDIATYTFGLKQESIIEASGVVIISFPGNVVPIGTPTCSMAAPTASNLSCTYSAPALRITLPASSIATQTAISLTITSIRNPASYQPLGSFTIQTKTSSNLYLYSSQLYNPSLSNSIPTSFQSLSYTFTPSAYAEPVSLQINFNPTDTNKVPAKLQLTLANSFIIGVLSCNSFIDFTGSCTAVSSNTIQVTGVFTSAAMGFSVTGFTSPSTAPSDFSTVITFDSNGYKMDESLTSIKFVIGCTLPCRTCATPSNPTVCTSCYSIVSITPSIYFDSDNQKCLTDCPDGKYENYNMNLCSPCDTNCLTCNNTATYCLSCSQSPNSTFKFLFLNTSIVPNTQTCLSACPSRMYGNAGVCISCISPCVLCNGQFSCLSCVTGTFLSGNACVTSCPAGTTIPNPTTNNCDPCNSNCLTCENLTTTCTSCTSPLLLYLSQCLTTCPSPLVPQNSTCGPCSSSCLTCITDPNTCTSCNTGSNLPYLLNNRCLSDCPQLYYKNIGSGICSLCSSVVGLNCNNCSTVSVCKSCNIGYVLFNGSCINYVPTGYVNISGVAVVCKGDCATCIGTDTNCTTCINNNLLNNICYATCPAGYIGINKICQPCTLPCKTCSPTQTSCTSCTPPTPPASPTYLTSNQCLATCPDSTYPNSANYTCAACTSPCQYCSSAAQCITCLNGFFLANSSCLTVCPSGFTGVNRLCVACAGNCALCVGDATYCIACKTGTYLYQLNNSCVANCGNGLFVDAATQTCVFCTAPCKTCTNTSTTCLSCLTGALHNNQCPSACPSQYFNLTGVCQQCPLQCSACLSLTNCTQCSSPYLLYNGYCLSQCPATHAIVLGGSCSLCTGASCHECTSADVCTMCDNGYSLLNGACLGECPAAYKSNGTHCVDINQEVLTTSNSFPVPFSIAGAVILIACLMSKLQFSKTFLPGAIFAFLGILQTGALAFFIALYYSNSFTAQPLPFFLGLAAIAYLMLLNFLAFFIQNLIFCNDKQYLTWSSHSPNKCSIAWINIISLLVSHKFRNILFCKLFTFTVFSAQLDSISKFKVMNVFSFLSLICSGAAIFAVSVAVGTAGKQTQLFYQCIDVIVLTSLNVVLAFFNVMKPTDFFYQMTPEGFELKRKIKAEQDYYEHKVQVAGKQAQQQEGFYSNVYHLVQAPSSKQALVSTQPFKSRKHNLYSISSNQDESFGNIKGDQQQIKYENMSVQAVDMIADRSFDDHQKNNFDLTAIPGLGHEKLQQNSNYTTIFNKSDKGIGVSFAKAEQIGIQNTIDHGPSLKSEAVGVSGYLGPSLHDISIQPTNNKMVDQSVQGYDFIEPVDRSVQRTIFFKQDQSMQYASSMKTKPPSLHDVSISNLNPSMHDKSIQQQKSKTNKSIMYQPSVRNQSNQKSISKYDQQIQNKPEEQQAQVQAVQAMSDKGIQQEVSIQQKSIQYDQSVKDKSVQMVNVVQFDEVEDMLPSREHEKVIFQEESVKNQSPRGTQLKQQQTDQFILPKQQLKSYQQQLEQRIRDKQKQLSQIKRKVEIQERKNQQKLTKLNKKANFIDQSNRTMGRGQPTHSMNDKTISNSNQEEASLRGNNIANTGYGLKKENKLIEEEVDAEVDRTIQEIDIIDDNYNHQHDAYDQKHDGQYKNAKAGESEAVQANIYNEGNTQKQFIGMLQDHPNKVIFDADSNEEGEQNNRKNSYKNQNISSRFKEDRSDKTEQNKLISNEENRKQRKGVQFSESMAEISSGKDGSTNVHSSVRPNNFANRQIVNKKLSNADQFEDSQSNVYDPIISRPIKPFQPHSISDMSQTIEQMHPHMNQTTSTYLNNESVKTKIKQMLPNFNSKNIQNSRLRKQVPSDGNQDRREELMRKRFQSNSNAVIPKSNKIQDQEEKNKEGRKSAFMLVGKSQFTQQGLARKQIGKNSPLKTVKRWEYENQNKNVEESGGQEEVGNTRALHAHLVTPMQTDKGVIDFKTSRVQGDKLIIPAQRKTSKIQQRSSSMIDQISPFVGEIDISVQPKKPKIVNQQISMDYGTSQQDPEPYIEQQQYSDQASRYKSNLVLAQMLERPGNSQLRDYYGKKQRRSKQKSSNKNSSFNEFQTDTEKIYQQKLNPHRKR